MKYCLLLVITFLTVQVLSGQETESSVRISEDSLKFTLPELYQPGLDFSGSLSELSLTELNNPLIFKAFDFSDVLKSRWQINYAVSRFSYFPSGFFHFPYPGTGMVYNQASWKASPKLTVGGSSFGLSSPFHAPLPGSASGVYPVRGMSVFMEYKIGKNFRIGGGVTVSGHQP